MTWITKKQTTHMNAGETHTSLEGGAQDQGHPHLLVLLGDAQGLGHAQRAGDDDVGALARLLVRVQGLLVELVVVLLRLFHHSHDLVVAQHLLVLLLENQARGVARDREVLEPELLHQRLHVHHARERLGIVI